MQGLLLKLKILTVYGLYVFKLMTLIQLNFLLYIEPCLCILMPFDNKVVDAGGPEIIILATGSEVRGFKPGRGR